MLAYLIALALPVVQAGTLPWNVLPEGGGPDGRLEAAWLARDVRTACAAMQRQRQMMQEVPPGRALLAAAPGLAESPCLEAFKWFAPTGSPVPMVAALLSADSQYGIMMAVQVEAGFMDRLRRTPPPGWRLQVEGDAFSLEHEQLRWVGRLGSDGWLRLSDDARWLSATPRTDAWVSQTLQARLSGSDMAVVLAGDSALAARLARGIPHPALAGLATATRHMVLAWQSDGRKTALWRVLVDAEFLRRWPKAQSQGSMARQVDAQAQGFAALQLPPDWQDVLPMLMRNTAALRDAPDTWLDALRNLQGRVAWVDFGVPGDGALFARCDTQQHAQAIVPALRDWAKSHENTLLTGAAQNFVLEDFPSASGPALHLQPEQGVEGPWLAAQNERVFFVQQRERLRQVLATGTPERSLLDGPLTDLMRSTLAGQHPFQSYWVLGGNGAWFDYLVWGAGHAQKGWEPHQALQPMKRLLPQVFAVASYLWQRTYDVAVTADVSDSVLEIQLAHSEI